MEKRSLHNTIIPSILVHIFYLHTVFDLIYNISSFILSYLVTKLEAKPELHQKNSFEDDKLSLITSRESLEVLEPESDDYVCLHERDIQIIMQKLGIQHSLEGENEVQKSWGSNEILGIFEEEPCAEELKESFRVFDQNGDGFIDAWELQRVLCVLGFKQGKELKACNKMIKKFDENKDGKIDFNEFLKLMLKSFEL